MEKEKKKRWRRRDVHVFERRLEHLQANKCTWVSLLSVLLSNKRRLTKRRKQPKSTFKSVDPTLKLETWILKNSGLKLLYYHILKLDQNSLKFKFPTSKLDQQTWMLTLVVSSFLSSAFCCWEEPIVMELKCICWRVSVPAFSQIREHLASSIFSSFPSPYSVFNIENLSDMVI